MDAHLEQLLFEKQFYQSLVKNEDVLENIRTLSSRLNHSNTIEGKIADELRFAQAELYLLLEDYETAIYKWESIKNGELSGWAMKNMGDAYQRLGLAEKAETCYLSVSLPSAVLKMENLLSLYMLYTKEYQEKKAHRVVNELVSTDFSYKNVVELALQFYEQIKDYLSAFILVVNQLEKDYNESFISRLYMYLEESADKPIPPSSTISKLLVTVWTYDKNNFEMVFQALNKYYIESQYFLDWFDCLFQVVGKINQPFEQFLLDEQALTFYHLIDLLFSGMYSTLEIKSIVENHLPIYYTVCPDSPLKSSLGSLLAAWEEANPNSIGHTYLKNIKFTSQKIYTIENMHNYYSYIKRWMKNLDIDYDPQSSWWLDYWIVNKSKKVMVAGSFSNGKSSFINSILKENILRADHLPTTSAVTIIQYGEARKLLELNNSSIINIELSKFQSTTSINHEQSGTLSNSLISLQLNAKPLQENQVTFIDTPGFNDNENNHYNPTYDFLYLADELLFLFNAETPYKKTEKNILLEINRKQPDLPIRFILNKADYLDEDEQEEVIEDIERKLIKHFNQDIMIIPFSSLLPNEVDQEMLCNYFGQSDISIYQRRIYKTIPYFNQFLNQFSNFLHAKEQKVNNLLLLRKKEVDGLKELKQKYYKYKNETISQVTQLFVKNVVSSIYNEIREQTLNKLRELSREFSSRIDVSTNFDNVHILFDKEMNDWLEANLTHTVFPKIYYRFGEWLQSSSTFLTSVEFEVNQLRVEVEDLINASQERIISLQKETFIEEMKNRFQETVTSINYKQLDILKKINPLQNILSGVGRLLGGKSHSTSLKLDKYRHYLETESYEEPISQYLFNITKTLGIFEDTIRNKCDYVLHEFEDYIDNQIQISSQEMIKQAQILKKLYVEKDSYFETIKVFKLKLRQIEIDFAGANNRVKIMQ